MCLGFQAGLGRISRSLVYTMGSFKARSRPIQGRLFGARTTHMPHVTISHPRTVCAGLRRAKGKSLNQFPDRTDAGPAALLSALARLML